MENIYSYRPIYNLSSIGKIIQQYIKNPIMAFLDINDTIVTDHHGSRKDHSTNSALASLTHTINNHYQSNKYTTIIQTDLSESFNTVDHAILLEKLRHYGIDGA